MILGTLSLFHKSGKFYKDVLFHPEENYNETIQNELKFATGLEAATHIKKHQITPVDEDGDTDYVEVQFTDAGVAQYPYQVTVWLVITEHSFIDK